MALAAWLRARASSGASSGASSNERGAFVVRMEDLDPPRVVPGAADRILDDLAWLGLDWDEGPRLLGMGGGPHGPYEQSRRGEHYARAIAKLDALGLVYPCTCTRAEIARASSAPHAGEEGPIYPGTCRDPAKRRSDRPAALRLRVPHRVIAFDDAVAGHQSEDVASAVGDFVLRRADGVASYQLAVVVDDLEMEIDEVVRGDDLLSSTARQILLFELLSVAEGRRAPRFVHLPMVLGPDGERLAKRHQSRFTGSTVRELRDAKAADEIVGELAAALGVLDEPRPTNPRALVDVARTRPPMRRAPWLPPGITARAARR